MQSTQYPFFPDRLFVGIGASWTFDQTLGQSELVRSSNNCGCFGVFLDAFQWPTFSGVVLMIDGAEEVELDYDSGTEAFLTTCDAYGIDLDVGMDMLAEYAGVSDPFGTQEWEDPYSAMMEFNAWVKKYYTPDPKWVETQKVLDAKYNAHMM